MTGRIPQWAGHGRRAMPLLGAAIALALAVPAAADATTFTVDPGTQASDAPLAAAVDVAAGDCTSTLPGGACTVRSALQAASQLATSSTVSIPAGTYELTIGQEANRLDDGSVGNL